MDITIRRYREEDLSAMTEIWNAVVNEGDAFPQTEPLVCPEEAQAFFAGQSFTGVAADGDTVLGLYILHPNNIAAAGICAMQALRLGSRQGGSTSVSAWLSTAWNREGSLGSAYCSSTRSSGQTLPLFIYMKSWVL